MTRKRLKYQILTALLLCFLQAAGIVVYGQNRPRAALRRSHELQADTTHKTLSPQQQALKADTLDALAKATADSIANENKKKMLELTASPDIKQEKDPTDSLSRELKRKQWVPNPTKATWLALVIPGGGQIYNRAVNEKWDSSSITDLLPPGYIDRVSHSQITETLRKRKDTYRRWRDLSIFAFIGVYLISVVDAYVDAELSNFDIGPDLSMKVEPTLINNQTGGYYNPATLKDKSVGVQCSFRF